MWGDGDRRTFSLADVQVGRSGLTQQNDSHGDSSV